VKPGSIILLHDLHPWVVDAVPTIITSLKTQGYEFVTVGELIGYNPSQAEKYQGVVYNRMPE
jgi:peptidoglycan/xylan/chitin deacetylase (PgdA/CDA1 family)